LADRAERLTAVPDSLVLEMDAAADSRRLLSILKATRHEERALARHQGRKLDDFDVYLCHNAVDKPVVKQLANQLLEHNIIPWLDEWECGPGESWSDQLTAQVTAIGCIAVFAGDGPPPWQDKLLGTLVRLFASKGVIVPVILPECQTPPNLPGYFQKKWVDLRVSEPDPMAHLVQSIKSK
jgi:hypothetical protein